MTVLFLACGFAAAALLAAVVNWLALIPYRRAREAHWTERARRLYPARLGAAMNLWLLPADLVLGQRLLWPETAPPWVLAALAAWAGATAATYLFDHEVFPWLTLRPWLHQVAALWTLRFGWCFLFFGIMAVMPWQLDWRCWALAGLFVVAFVVWARGGAVWLCRQLRLVVPAPERLRLLVAEVAERMGTRVRGVWVLRAAGSNAFAMPYTGDLLFSERLIDLHPEDEIAAICAHELGHLVESKFDRAARLVGLFIFVPWLFAKPLFHAESLLGVVIACGATLLALVSARRIGRRLEVRADGIAHANESTAGTYARALCRIYEANLIPAAMPRKRHGHPDLYDRMLAAGVQPDFPRPAKASSIAWPALLFAVLLGLLIMLTVDRLTENDQRGSLPREQSAPTVGP